jgi:hypothetical protein
MKSVIEEPSMLVTRTTRFTTLGLALLLAIAVFSSGFFLKHFFTPNVVSAEEMENSLSTPPLTVGTSLDCIAANIGRTPVTLIIELHDMNGEVAFNQTCRLPPGAVNAGGRQCSIIEGAPLFVGYCTFKVTNGDKRDIRAAILSQDANLGTGGLSAALPAQ